MALTTVQGIAHALPTSEDFMPWDFAKTPTGDLQQTLSQCADDGSPVANAYRLAVQAELDRRASVLPFRREVVPGWTVEEILAREG